ncbi:hypothetical protein MXB_417, partial [Myxobolus squamalis]
MDGSFRFENMPSGYFALNVISPNHYFSPVLVRVEKDGAVSARYIGDLESNILLPIVFHSLNRINYSKPQSEYTFYSILTNPLIILVGVSFLLVKLQGSFSNPENSGNLDNPD